MLNRIIDSYDKCRKHVNCEEKRFTMSDKSNDNPKKIEAEKNNEKQTEPVEQKEQETPQASSNNNEEAQDANELAEIRSDVNQLSDDLQTTVTDLKKSIVDIRSAVSEIENPFNLLRTISNEKDLKKLNGQRLPSGVKSLVVGKPEKKTAANSEIKEETPEKNTTPPPQPSPTPEPQPQSQSQPQTQPKPEIKQRMPETEVQSNLPVDGSAYIDWIWGLLDSGLKASDIQQLACSCELMGYLPAQTNEFIYSLAVVAEKFRQKKLTKEHLLLSMYKAASLSKVKIGREDVEALITITDNQLKKPKSVKGAR